MEESPVNSMINILPDIGFWDLILIFSVSIQSVILAYMPSARGKALLLSLPIPFTLAVMAVGQDVGPTNVIGLIVLFIFTQSVRILHHDFQMPIIPSILCSLLGYCLIGWGLARMLPETDRAFWWCSTITVAVAFLLYKVLPYRAEGTQPTPLPVWQKLPMVIGVVTGLVLIKDGLHGFATIFPMLGVVSAYEARHCLWTMGRQITVIMLTMAPMMITIFITQHYLGLGFALLLSWTVYLGLFIPIMRARRHEDGSRKMI